MNIRKFLLLVFILITFHGIAIGQTRDPFDYFSLGIEYGAWHPNNLRIADKGVSLKSINENLFAGAYIIAPLKAGLSLRLTTGYFRHTSIDDRYNRIELLPILVDIKYQLLADSRITPYVSYGVGTCAAKQPTKPSPGSGDNFQFGLGLNLGTGFDILLLKHWAIGFEFRYHYLQFKDPLIVTDDFSGPKVNMSLYYLLK